MSANLALLEKRSYPRIPLFRPGTLSGANGASVKANLRDLSPDGIQAMCDRTTAAAIAPDGRMLRDGRAPVVTARFNLPLDGQLVELEIECRVARIGVVPDEGIALGLFFLDFKGESFARLRRFILRVHEPA